MKVKELKKVLASMAKIKPYKTLPALENFVIKDGKMIWGDLGIQKEVEVPYEGTFLAPFEKIKKIVSKLPTNSHVDLRADEDGTVYLETDNGDQFSFQVTVCLDERSLFERKEHNKQRFLTRIDKEDINKLGVTSNFVIKDELRPVLEQVCIDKDKAVASDAHCIWHEDLSQRTEDNFLINPLAINLLTEDQYNVFGITGEKEESWRWIKFAGEKETIYFKEQEGTFPNWRSNMPPEQPNKFKVETEELIKTIESGNIVSSIGIFRFEVSEIKLVVSTQDIDFGTAYRKEISIDGAVNENNVFGVKSEVLLPMLKSFKSQKVKSLDFEFTNSEKVILINGKLMMPYNINYEE